MVCLGKDERPKQPAASNRPHDFHLCLPCLQAMQNRGQSQRSGHTHYTSMCSCLKELLAGGVLRVVERKWQRDEEKLASEAGDILSVPPFTYRSPLLKLERVVPLQFPEQLLVQKICTRRDARPHAIQFFSQS